MSRRRRRQDGSRAALLAELRAEVAELDPASWGVTPSLWPWAGSPDYPAPTGWQAGYVAWCVASVADVRRREYVALGLGGEDYTPDDYDAAAALVADVGLCADAAPEWWTSAELPHPRALPRRDGVRLLVRC